MLDTIDDDMPVPIDAGTRNAAHMAATKLIDENVYDPAGRRVGEIEELILDTRTGCVRYVVLRFGGFLGIGRKRFAIPWRALTPDPEHHRCVLDVAHASLMAIPVFDDDRCLQRIQVPGAEQHSFPLRQRILTQKHRYP